MEQFAEHGSTQVGRQDDVGDRLLLRVEEAALRLQIGRTTMYDLIRRGEIESVPIGRLRRIPAECLDEYVNQLRTAQNRTRETPSSGGRIERPGTALWGSLSMPRDVVGSGKTSGRSWTSPCL